MQLGIQGRYEEAFADGGRMLGVEEAQVLSEAILCLDCLRKRRYD